MLAFFTDCVSLFTHTFNAALRLDYFRFLIIIVVVFVSFGLFSMLSHGMRKM